MIKNITTRDRKRNPDATKGKRYKLVAKNSGRVLGYGSKSELIKRERQVQYFKSR